MPEVTAHRPGTPAWFDLATRDPAGARDFYSALFGWKLDVGPDDEAAYVLCRLHGHAVAGMNGQPVPEGMAPAWVTYFVTENAEDTAARITTAGGRLLFGPVDVDSQGRVVVAFDPAGVLFGLWQPGEHPGATLVNEPGSVVWNELVTPDLGAAQRFYADVLGWTWEVEDTGGAGPDYRTFSVDGHLAGGAMQIPAHGPPAGDWRVYFAVADTDAAVATVERLGGTVHTPPADSPYGRLAAVADPQGGAFAVITTPAAG